MAMTDLLPAGAAARPGQMPLRRPSMSASRRFGHFGAAAEPGAIADINTTPLIDVMLVLLIMFIITIPMASHNVPLDLPRPAPPVLEPRPFHQLDIASGGALSWNGVAISEDQLTARLQLLAADPAMPELRLNAASEARYEQVDRLLARIRLAGVGRLGFIGNERYGGAF